MSNSEKTFKMFVGPMWSSKTTHLLLELEKCKFQEKKTVLFKPGIDSRYSSGAEIVSHAGWKWPAVLVNTGEDILQYLYGSNNYDTIALDEAFMVPGSAKILNWLFRNSYNVVVASLDLNSQLKEFDEIKEMMPWATQIKKLDAACAVCRNVARYTHRKHAAENVDSVFVGGEADYEPRCHKCHPAFVSEL